MSAPLIEAYVRANSDLQTSKFSLVSGYILLAYDILLTLDDEYQHIWKARWSVGKVLYLLVRYPWFIGGAFSVYGNLDPSVSILFCSRFTTFEMYGAVVQMGIVQLILVIRTYILYDRNKWILSLLIFLYLATNGLDFGFTIKFLPRISYLTGAETHMQTGCLRSCVNCHVMFRCFWIAKALLDLVIAALTLFKALQDAKAAKHLTPLLRILYRDGFLYFAIIFATQMYHLVLWNIVASSFDGPFATKTEFVVPIMRSMNAILCSRLLLNLRGVLTADRTLHTLSGYRFRQDAGNTITLESTAHFNNSTTPNESRLPSEPQDKC